MRKNFTIAILALSMNAFAQIPTTGLVGYWPFNGNANDESGNGNNGTVFGATLTTDRFGIQNCAYYFEDNIISVPHNPDLGFISSAAFTVSIWCEKNVSQSISHLIGKRSQSDFYFNWQIAYGVYGEPIGDWGPNFGSGVGPGQYVGAFSNDSIPSNQWTHIIGIYDNGTWSLYVNGILKANNVASMTNDEITPLTIGNSGGFQPFFGKLDDSGIWNRALTQQEIVSLYTACNLTLQISPSINLVATNSNTQFTVISNAPSATYQWQSDHANFGWTNVPANSTYSGTASSTLNIDNVQLSNHLQPFRVIATSGICTDTSDVAILSISDTCVIVVNDTTFITVTDTTLISVTDTLIINAVLTGVDPPNNINTIKIYPNPASTHIYIDNGDFATMAGYTMKIVNSAGQAVFNQLITQQLLYVDLSGWSGPGTYIVYISDNLNNIINTKTIVLQ